MSTIVVEHTNDFSTDSKYSCVQAGYFNDEYIHLFVANHKRRRAPLVHRGYAIRSQAVSWALNQVDPDVIIYLGSGFDTLALRYKHIKVIEVDLPQVATKKRDVLVENGLVSKFDDPNQPWIKICEDTWTLIAGDLREPEILVPQIMTQLEKMSLVNSLVCILNECSLCYLDVNVSNAILTSLVDTITKSGHQEVFYVGYEQIKPENFATDGFWRVMVDHFQKMGSPLLTLLTKQEQESRFKTIGFKNVSVMDMNEFESGQCPKSKSRIDTLEPFDEFEELKLLKSCYAITIAHNFQDFSWQPRSDLQSPDSCLPCPRLSSSHQSRQELPEALWRYGHCSTMSPNGQIIVYGGVRGQKVSQFVTYHHDSPPVAISVPQAHVQDVSHDKFSQIIHLDGNKFLLSGGRKSPMNIGGNFVLDIEDNNVLNIKPVHGGRRFRHTLTKMDTDKVVLIGGRSENLDMDVVTLFSPISETWTPFSISDQIGHRHSHATVQVDGNTMIVSGGLSMSPKQDWLIDLRGHCSLIAGMKKLFSHQICQLSPNKFAIIGGIMTSHGMSNNLVSIYDLRNQKMVNHVEVGSQNDDIMMCHNFTAHVIDGQKIVTIGGGGNCFTFGTHFNHQMLDMVIT